MTLNVQHSAKSPEHYTPVALLEAARFTMGGIDLDPASTDLVNHENVDRVQALCNFQNAFTGFGAVRL